MLREDLIDNIKLPDDTPPDLTQASKVIVSALFEAAAKLLAKAEERGENHEDN